MARVLLLVPSATYRVGDFLEAARALGVDVVIGGEEAHSLPSLMGSRSLEIPLDDPPAAAEAIVAHDLVAPLDAVVAVDDRGLVAAALAGERLGLRHNPPAAVAATRDKQTMRRLLAGAEVSQPVFAVLEAKAEPQAVAALVEAVGLPCVIKPTTLSGSQGVLRADTVEEAVGSVERVRRIAAACDGPLLVERFVPGPEVAVEGLLSDGELTVLAVFDKPDPLDGPAFEETIYVTPSRLDSRDIDAVVSTTAAACRALGLTQGPVHAEIRVRSGRASVIEVAARTIGGLCARTLTFSTGKTLEQLVLTQALGRPLGTTRRRGEASGVLMIPIPAAGILEAVGGTAEARQVPGVTDIQITIPIGHRVVPVPEGDRYLGFVFVRGTSPGEVEATLRAAQDVLDVRVV
jgi:biotin carboxylase